MDRCGTGSLVWVPIFIMRRSMEETIAQYDVEDWYLNEDGSLKLWRHYILTDVPEGMKFRSYWKTIPHLAGAENGSLLSRWTENQSVQAQRLRSR